MNGATIAALSTAVPAILTAIGAVLAALKVNKNVANLAHQVTGAFTAHARGDLLQHITPPQNGVTDMPATPMPTPEEPFTAPENMPVAVTEIEDFMLHTLDTAVPPPEDVELPPFSPVTTPSALES